MRSHLITGGSAELRSRYIQAELTALEIATVDRLYVKMNEKTSIHIAQIRQLTSQLQLKPSNSKAKAGIILRAEKITLEGQHALLKLLEEPPKNVYIFLAAPTPQHLLATITSRCKIVFLKQNTSEFAKSVKEKSVKIFTQLLADKISLAKKIKIIFESAQLWGQTRQSAEEFLDAGIYFFRQQYLNSKDKQTIISSTKILRNFLLAKQLLAANVNPRQVLENLLLTLSQ